MFDDRIIHCANEDEWLAERRRGIGASDAAVILGVSAWSSPYQLWAEKTELVEPADLSDREWIEWGNRLEPIIAEAFAERTGRTIEMWSRFDILKHKDIEWMRCTPDAIQKKPVLINSTVSTDQFIDVDCGLIQIKTTGAFNADEWENEPPLQYQVQIQHEMEVTGLTWGTLVVLIGGQRLVWFDVERNNEFIEAMIREEAAFWNLVDTETPPEIDSSKATAEAIKKLYPDDSGESIALPVDAIAWAERLDELKREITEREDQRRLLENKIKAAIGANTYGLLSNGSGFSYKTQVRKEYTVPGGSFRVLRRMKGNG